jgi:Tfp pilus assembly protein PilX
MTIRRQRGATLLVALIMLVVLMLFVVSSMNTANINLKIVGNMQAKHEALNAAREAIETTISQTDFISSPSNAVPTPCGAANTICANVSGNSTPDYTTVLTPQPACITVKPIKNTELNLTSAEDAGCAAGQQQQFGVSGAVTGNSLCSNSIWEITAQTTATNSAASATLVEGVGVRISADDADASCL